MTTQHRSLGKPLAAETLREIEHALEVRLRAHHISEVSIARCEEDSIQKAFAEYLRALEEGREISNRDAFIVDVAFKRAVDEIRAEVRRGDPATLAAIAGQGIAGVAAAEELATDQVFAEELHEAIGSLPPEKRQVLSLYYFEQKTMRECAEALFVSESSLRRALKAAIATLRRRLGVEIPDLPDRDDRLGYEIGLAAWVVSRGAQTPPVGDVADRVLAMLAQLRRTLTNGVEKLRELTWRPPPAAGEEGLRTLIASPFGRAAGACAGAAVCALGGAAIWSGTPDRQPQPPLGHTGVTPAHRVVEAPSRPPNQPVVRPHQPGRQNSASPSSAHRITRESSRRSRIDKATAGAKVAASHPAPRSTRESEEELKRVRAQTSGLARIENHAASPAPPAKPVESTVHEASEPAPVSPSDSSSASSESANSQSSEEAQVQEQFGAFK